MATISTNDCIRELCNRNKNTYKKVAPVTITGASGIGKSWLGTSLGIGPLVVFGRSCNLLIKSRL